MSQLSHYLPAQNAGLILGCRMDIAVFGSGYVGLVTAACLADAGNHVVCVDSDRARIKSLIDGELPFFEPGLDELVDRNVHEDRLKFTSDPETGVRHGLFQFIAVGTPPDEDGSADLSYVLQVAQTIGSLIEDYRIVVIKSTVPVGTADQIRNTLAQALSDRGIDVDYDIVSNPEFLRQGGAVGDFTRPQRLVFGTDGERPEKSLKVLYAPFNRNHDRMIFMDNRSAELTKYAANAMLATRISLMNELANLAERFRADIEHVRIGIGSDSRIGYHYLYPGCGYGGSCLSKDVRALIQLTRRFGYDPKLLNAVESVNSEQKTVMFEKIRAHFEEDLNGKTFAVWGLAFKPNTNDMREAPSRELIRVLWQAGCKVRVYDPEAMSTARRLWGEREDLYYATSPEDAVTDADALVLVTEWKVFRSPDFADLAKNLRARVLFDGRNIYDPGVVAGFGIHYYGIGRLPVDAA